VRSIGILCGLCLVLTGAAASGALLHRAPSTGSALLETSAKRTNGPHAAKVMLLGNQAVESTVDDNLVGTGEAFAFRARRGGAATSISVYLDKRDRATTLFAGLYSSRHGHPQALMTSGSRRSPKAGAWNSLAVRSAHLRSGTTYWLAILGKGGAMYFRDRNGSLCTGRASSSLKMLSLPRTWPAGRNLPVCLISAYVKGIGRASSSTGTRGGTPVFGTNAPTGPTTPGNGTTTTTTTTTTLPPPPPGVFCNVSAAYTDLATGPHLCGWPDSTNTGYENAPGYPGSLTVASSSSSTCPKIPQSNQTYQFCDYVGGLSLPANVTNVTFYGDKFESNAVNDANVRAGAGDNNITFDYDTFQPSAVSSPPVSCSQSYQYGIYNENGAMSGYTVAHSDFWGFGNAIDTSGSTQANPQIFHDNWIHDSSTTGGCGYHNDGIGMLNNGNESYAVVDHNTIEFLGNTNLIAWQNGTYSHIQNTNNLLSGDNEGYAGGRCTSSCSPPSYIQTTGNTYNTYLAFSPPGGSYPIDNATHFWSATGSTWNHNYWAVPPGAAWGTPAYNGYYWLPTTNSQTPQDCGFVSQTDYPNTTNPCK
jgi:hypothetical protein